MTSFDPMDMIQPSVHPESEAPDPADVDMSGSAECVRLGDSNGPLILIAKTPEGIRTILGRKKRRRPLLSIACKGCLMTSHDPDIFVQGDTLEFLACIG